MDGTWFLGICVSVLIILVVTGAVKRDPSPRTIRYPFPSAASSLATFDLLNRLPFAFYLLGIIGGFILFGFAVATAAESSTAETGAMFGYTIGATISIIAFGRVIEVLQQIRDAVRNIPALSPGKPDESNPPEPRTGDKS